MIKARAFGSLKGQTFTIEVFLVLIAVFIIMIVFLHTMDRIVLFREKTQKMVNIADSAAELLITSSGSPNWEENPSNASALGLVKKRGAIDNDKLDALNQTNYTELLSLRDYDFRLRIYVNDTVLYELGSINESLDIVVSERNCIINNTACRLKAELSGIMGRELVSEEEWQG